MLRKRIIPCLDIKNAKVVKGTNFVDLEDVGDPVDFAKMYEQQCADEVVFLDITASYEERDIIKDIIEKGAEKLSIPLTVGGGIRTIEDFREILKCGADKVSIKGGRENTGIDLIKWAKECEELGAGEILLTSMDADGTKKGYDIPMVKAVVENVNIPVIASGGCGSIEDIIEVFKQTDCDAALVASLFHYNQATIEQVKVELEKNGISVRRVKNI